MTSLERTLTALGHQEPDRVPVFLLLTMHGAKELGLSLREYFSRADHVVEGQLRLRQKYGHDCVYGLFYGPVEIEDAGGEIVYREDGPVTGGRPMIRRREDIRDFEPVAVADAPRLQEVLKAIAGLKAAVGNDAPVLGVAISPFSLPVLQMGFDAYLNLIYEDFELWQVLMQKNMAFCAAWANAQFAAGATAVAYFDPVSSPMMIPRELFLRTGFPVACETVARFQGPAAMHLASGRVLPILDDAVRIGTPIISCGANEPLGDIKAAARGKITLLGNLNGVAMRRWSPADAEAAVKTAIAQAGPGGGFVLSDLHGEIPFQVSEDVLHAVVKACHAWGRYPLDWV